MEKQSTTSLIIAAILVIVAALSRVFMYPDNFSPIIGMAIFAGAVIKAGTVYANVQFPGMLIRYTTDGKEPNAGSVIYTKPITQKGIIKLKVFNKSGRYSVTTIIENK